MLFDPHQAIAVLANSLAVAALPATPCLTIFAFRTWAKRLRNNPPGRRNVLGLLSIIFTSLCWLGYVTLFALVGFTRIRPDQTVWVVSELLLLCLGISSTVALKSSSRVLTLFANMLIILPFLGVNQFLTGHGQVPSDPGPAPRLPSADGPHSAPAPS